MKDKLIKIIDEIVTKNPNRIKFNFHGDFIYKVSIDQTGDISKNLFNNIYLLKYPKIRECFNGIECGCYEIFLPNSNERIELHVTSDVVKKETKQNVFHNRFLFIKREYNVERHIFYYGIKFILKFGNDSFEISREEFEDFLEKYDKRFEMKLDEVLKHYSIT